MTEEFSKYIVIPYHVLIEAAAVMEEIGEPDNSFKNILETFDEYLAADLTPIILYNPESHDMYCIVKELYGKKLH